MAKKKLASEKVEPVPVTDKTSVASVESIADTLAGKQSEPSQSFLEKTQQEEAEKKGEWADLRDKLGYTFDPAIHLSAEDGSPRLNKGGDIKRRRQRKKGKDSDAISEARSAQLTADQQTQARYAGVAAANSLLVVCRGLGGDEWQPQKDEAIGIDEKAELSQAFGDYFVSKGWTEFPPGIALALCVSMYAAPRFTLPQTQTRIKSAWNKTAAWFKRRKKGVAQFDTRHDRERENDTREDSRGDGKKAWEAGDRTRSST